MNPLSDSVRYNLFRAEERSWRVVRHRAPSVVWTVDMVMFLTEERLKKRTVIATAAAMTMIALEGTIGIGEYG